MASPSSPPHERRRRVLVVEDSPEFALLAQHTMESEGHEVKVAVDGRAAVEQARTFQPDVVILDLVLPDMTGLEVCRELRTFTDAYVVMVTARDDEIDKVIGLSIGADDYVTKPFSPRELAARVAAMLRRPRADVVEDDEDDGDRLVLQSEHLRVDVGAHEVWLDGSSITLTKLEFGLLRTLLGRPTIVFTRAMLRAKVWGEGWHGDDHVVDVHIANLRKKVDAGRDDSCIRTVRGVGYRFVG